MNIHQTTIWEDISLHERSGGRRRRARARGMVQYLLFSLLGTSVAIVGPTLFVLAGIGMSRQEGDVAANGAIASMLAIIASFLVIRRLLSFPLLRSYSYIALTFFSSFIIVATVLKFFRIDFSSPQLFLGMVMITTMVEVFFYIHSRWTPLRIAIVPGAQGLMKVSKGRIASMEFTALNALPSAEFDYSGVVADLDADLEPEWERFLALSALQGIPVYHVKQFNESITGQVAVDHLRENTLGAVVPSLIYPQFKRAIDFLVALVLLPFVVLIVMVCAIAIKLDTPGPLFYCQRRAGFRGRLFTIYKLRTMTQEQGGEAYTLPDDKRITRVGRVLRQYRFDELPQVINILRGDMSWVGPRPEVVSLAEWYEREVPFYVYRHIVRPGITGWAQVHQGNVAAVEAARLKLEYDFFYIKHFSFWLDAVIVAKTLRTIVTGFGSR